MFPSCHRLLPGGPSDAASAAEIETRSSAVAHAVAEVVAFDCLPLSVVVVVVSLTDWRLFVPIPASTSRRDLLTVDREYFVLSGLL